MEPSDRPSSRRSRRPLTRWLLMLAVICWFGIVLWVVSVALRILSFLVALLIGLLFSVAVDPDQAVYPEVNNQEFASLTLTSPSPPHPPPSTLVLAPAFV